MTCKLVPASVTRQSAVERRYKPIALTIPRPVEEDGTEMLDTAAAAGLWTDSAPHQPDWLVNRQHNHPHRVSGVVHSRWRSDQRRH